MKGKIKLNSVVKVIIKYTVELTSYDKKFTQGFMTSCTVYTSKKERVAREA